MERILITGMSGVGKSTVVAELVNRGYRAVDLDGPRWCEYVHPDAAIVEGGQAPQREWLWRETRIEELLDTERAEPLFVAGCAANQGGFYPHFDHVVLLTASVPVTIQRLASRTTNRFGKRPEELAKVLADKEEFEPLLRRGADLEIDTSAPLHTIVDTLLGLVRS